MKIFKRKRISLLISFVLLFTTGLLLFMHAQTHPRPNEQIEGIWQGTLKHSGIELPGLNHLLQTAETGAVSEYGHIEETISPEALKTIGDWILEQASENRYPQT